MLCNVCCRCGFAQSQEAYDKAVNQLFDALDLIDNHLGTSRYLCGDRLTLSDVCLFTTLIRFDIVYNVLFKCTKKKLVEYPNLHGYMRDIYQVLTFCGMLWNCLSVCVCERQRVRGMKWETLLLIFFEFSFYYFLYDHQVLL